MNYYEFLNAVAWVFGVASSGLVVIRIVGFLTYTELNRLHDIVTYRRERTFPIAWPLTIAIICWLHIWKVTP